jgi:hypothetical protein
VIDTSAPTICVAEDDVKSAFVVLEWRWFATKGLIRKCCQTEKEREIEREGPPCMCTGVKDGDR